MNLAEIRSLLDAQVLTKQSEDDLAAIDIKMICGSDLMSDVLAFVKDQGMLMTGLVNPQVVRTAEMMDIHTVCFVRGKIPDDDLIELAQSHGLALLTTNHPMYIACGKLYHGGLREKEE